MTGSLRIGIGARELHWHLTALSLVTFVISVLIPARGSFWRMDVARNVHTLKGILINAKSRAGLQRRAGMHVGFAGSKFEDRMDCPQ